MSDDVEYNNSLRNKILREIKTGAFASSERIPRKTVLSEMMGVSRTQLRDALTDLEREGFISRRHGIGTIINRHVLNVKCRMDIEKEFLEIIRSNGYQPDISYVHVQEEKADKFLADKLQIPEETEVMRVCRICTADGNPAIYCEDIFEKELIKEEYSLDDFQAPIFSFLKDRCHIEAYMDLTQLHAVLADEKVADALGITAGSPLLNMEEIDYDISGNIIFYSTQYFVDKYIEQTVLRKKL